MTLPKKTPLFTIAAKIKANIVKIGTLINVKIILFLSASFRWITDKVLIILQTYKFHTRKSRK